MSSVYRGPEKRFMEGVLGTSLGCNHPPGVEATVISSAVWNGAKPGDPHWGVLGPTTTYSVRSVGWDHRGHPLPLVVLNDVLDQVSGGSDGLLGLDSPILGPVTAVFEHAVGRDHLVLLPNDSHEREDWFNPQALSGVRDQHGRRLTMAELARQVGGAVMGSVEAGRYIPHCTDGITEPILPIREALLRQARVVAQQVSQGVVAPEVRIITALKDCLHPTQPPDERGRGGNKLLDLIIAGFTFPCGVLEVPPVGRYAPRRQAVVGGAFLEWSTEMSIVNLVIAGTHVIVCLTMTDALQIFDSTLHMAHMLKERHGNSVSFTYDWPFQSVEPREWDRGEQEAMKRDFKADLAFYPNWVGGDSTQAGLRDPSAWRRWSRSSDDPRGKPLIQSLAAIKKELAELERR